MEPPELFASNQKCLEALNLENPVLQALGIHARGPIQVSDLCTSQHHIGSRFR